VPKRHYFN